MRVIWYTSIMNNQGITTLIVLFFVVLVGYWFVNYSSYSSVAVVARPSTSLQTAAVYNAYPTTAAPVYTATPAAPVYAYPVYNNAYPAAAYYPSYTNTPRTYITYPIARSTSYSSSYYSSPGYYNSYTTTTNPGGTYPPQNCYTQPNGGYTCTYQQQY